MQGIPVPLTEQEIKEISQLLYIEDGGYYETIAAAEEDIRDHWAYKIERYITDGLGYSGDLYVIVWGVPDAVTTLERNSDGSLRAHHLNA